MMNKCHCWIWNFKSKEPQWICRDCGKIAESTDLLIEPCLICGAATVANQPYCSVCLSSQTYAQEHASTFGSTRRPRSMRDPASWRGASHRPDFGRSYRSAS